jgi:hypothetical protein
MPKTKNVKKVNNKNKNNNKNKVNVVVNVNSYNRKKNGKNRITHAQSQAPSQASSHSIPPIIIHPANDSSVASSLLALQRHNMDMRQPQLDREPIKANVFAHPEHEIYEERNNLTIAGNPTRFANLQREHWLQQEEGKFHTSYPPNNPFDEVVRYRTGSETPLSEAPLSEITAEDMKEPHEELHSGLYLKAVKKEMGTNTHDVGATKEMGTNPPKRITRTEINNVLLKYKDPNTNKKFKIVKLRALKDFDALHLYNTLTTEGQENPAILKK